MAKRRSRVSICRSANRLHTSKRVEPFPKDLHKQTNKQTNKPESQTHPSGWLRGTRRRRPSLVAWEENPEDRDSVKGFGCWSRAGAGDAS